MRWINSALAWANLYLPALQLIVVVVTGIAGWVFVTRANQELNSAKFAQSLTMYINTLKPSVNILCNAFIQSDGKLVGQVSVVNEGDNLITIQNIKRSLLNVSDGKSRGEWSTNSLSDLPKTAGVQVPISLTHPADAQWNELMFRGEATITTDSAVLALAQSIVGSRLTAAQLQTLGSTTASCMAKPHPQSAGEGWINSIQSEIE